MRERHRAGVVVCPIWGDLGVEGDFALLIHYRRTDDEPVMTAAYSRYNGNLTDISDKMRTLRLVPDWQERVPNAGKITTT